MDMIKKFLIKVSIWNNYVILQQVASQNTGSPQYTYLLLGQLQLKAIKVIKCGSLLLCSKSLCPGSLFPLLLNLSLLECLPDRTALG